MIVNFRSQKHITLESVFKRIRVAEGHELWDISEVVVKRFKECFPEWHVEFWAMPKDLNEQIRYLEQFLEILRSRLDSQRDV